MGTGEKEQENTAKEAEGPVTDALAHERVW